MNDLTTQSSVIVTYRIGEWAVDPDARTLARAEHHAVLSPVAMDVLIYLAERPGVTVTHEALLAEFWRGPISSTNAVHKCVAELRHALQNGDGTHYIETVPRRGYRLVAPVERIEAPAGAPVVRNGDTHAPAAPLETPGVARWRWVAVATAAVFAVAAFWVARDGVEALSRTVVPAEPTAATEATDAKVPKSIAVAPFTTGATAEDDFLGEGLAGELGFVLARSPDYLVKRGRPGTPADVARALEVDYVLTGSIGRDGDRLQIGVEVTEGASGTVLYSQRFDEPAADIFGVQDRIVGAVSTALSVHLDANRRAHMLKGGTANAEAYLAVMEANFHAGLSGRDNLERAVMLSRRALEIDPGFADAYHCLAMHLVNAVQFQTLERYLAVAAELESLAERAATAAPASGAAEGVRFVAAELTGDYPSQEAMLRALIKMPDASARRYLALEDLYGGLLRSAGLFVDSKQYSWHYFEKRPGEPPEWLWQDQAITLWEQGATAVIELRKPGVDALIANGSPLPVDAVTGLVALLTSEDRLDEAEYYYEHLARADTVGHWAHGVRAQLDIGLGRLTYGSPAWRAFVEHPAVSPTSAGLMALMLGEVDAGIEYWRQMNVIERGIFKLNRLYHEYWIPAAVRADPRYRRMLDEIGLGDAWRRQLEDGVRELEPYTGIALAADHPERVVVGNWRFAP